MRFLLTLLIFGMSFKSWGTVYTSPDDQEITIKSVMLLKPSDNLKGIYANPLQERLRSLLEKETTWTLLEESENAKSLEFYELNPKELTQLKVDADAALGVQITRTPKGFHIKVDLFSGKNGLLFLQEEARNLQEIETSFLQKKVESMVLALLNKIPYKALILSRRGSEVTVGWGHHDGAKINDIMTVFLISHIKRHPKFQFMVDEEKELIGKIRLTNVQERMSFAEVISERESYVIQENFKVSPVSFIEELPPTAPYPQPDKDTPFADVPFSNPRFGRVSLLVGLSQYLASSQIETTGGVNSPSNAVPTVSLFGELWLTPKWSFEVQLRQLSTTLPNPIDSSTPTKLSANLSSYQFNFGYNLLLGSSFFDPKIQLLGGLYKFKAAIDNSDSVAFTSNEYSGWGIGARGVLPTGLPMNFGAEFFFSLFPQFSESPVTSGDSATPNTINYSMFVDYELRENLAIKAQFGIESYATSFTGSGTRTPAATSLSHSLTHLMLGAEYLF